jgi:exodeoxyribonuclease VII small subunit
MTRKAEKPDFEHALSELESLVVRLEQGDLPIEDALASFEQGVPFCNRPSRKCSC